MTFTVSLSITPLLSHLQVFNFSSPHSSSFFLVSNNISSVTPLLLQSYDTIHAESMAIVSFYTNTKKYIFNEKKENLVNIHY